MLSVNRRILVNFAELFARMEDSSRILRIGTLFSGIGAFEEALNQLQIPYTIQFACDNGEIELIPLPPTERREYRDLEKRARSLSEEEKVKYIDYKNRLNETFDNIRNFCYSMPTKKERTDYVNGLYKKYSPQRFNWVKKAYLQNYHINSEDFHTDVRFLKGSDYAGEVDILVGGSPCQSFSNYGKRRGLDDTRGTLFYDYARIIKESRPQAFVYENVESILTNDHGKTWEVIQDVFRSLDYSIFYDVIDSAEHNFPQKRRRLFLIGFRNDLGVIDYKFPEKKPLTLSSTDFLETGTIPNIYYLGKKGFEWITTIEKHQHRARVNQDVIGTQTANQQCNWTGDLRIEKPRFEHYQDDRIFIGQFDFGQGMEDAVARKLTPRECLNLMGFSSSFNIEGLTDVVAYRLAGNSIVVPVLKDIVLSILPYLKLS